MARRKKQAWAVGDVVIIPQKDGQFVPCQLLDHVMENVVGVSLYEMRLARGDEVPDLGSIQPISILLTTRDLLDEGMWEVVGRQEVAVSQERRPYERFRSADWIGAKVQGAGIVRQFLDACFGLDPWDDWKDPDYLDALLLDPTRRPAGIVYKKS